MKSQKIDRVAARHLLGSFTDLPLELLDRITMPTLVFRSGESDAWHTRATSEAVAAGLPNARVIEPPWGDREWLERSAKHRTGEAPLFTGWPALASPLLAWADEVLG